MTNTMHIMRGTIRQSWVGPKAKPQSACSKQNYPWRNLPKGWGSPTFEPSTSGRKYGGLGFSRRSISQLSGDSMVWNSCEVYPCTGKRRLQIFQRHSRPGCLWKIQLMPNGFGHTGRKCCWWNVQARFERQRRMEGEATSEGRWIWNSVRTKERDVTSQSCQIQLSWLWFVECKTATMTRRPACNSKLCIQMWGTGRSWLISSNKIVAQKNHTVWPQYTNATWHRENWTKSIWDYMPWGKWWMTRYMVGFHNTVPFLIPSSRNWDTM